MLITDEQPATMLANGRSYATNPAFDLTPAENLPQWTVAFRATVDTADDGAPFALIDPDLAVKEWRPEGQSETEETR